ncbi:hypothetical protein CS022_01635 [Veronia nyctiphanis]|uniref:Uncharacterized protein n=1 Tax=Veronia nyctiphanis TaxID=1278244 RepID=A0A4Q0YVS7_9GAMM|nr:hypothetical protein CS022_01635 [Veronia nyctiphanis]
MYGLDHEPTLHVLNCAGKAYLLTCDGFVIPASQGIGLDAGHVLMTGVGSNITATLNGTCYEIDQQSIACINFLDREAHGAELSITDLMVDFDPQKLNSDVAFDIDVVSIQKMVIEGIDPTSSFVSSAHKMKAGVNGGFINAVDIIEQDGQVFTSTEMGAVLPDECCSDVQDSPEVSVAISQETDAYSEAAESVMEQSMVNSEIMADEFNENMPAQSSDYSDGNIQKELETPMMTDVSESMNASSLVLSQSTTVDDGSIGLMPGSMQIASDSLIPFQFALNGLSVGGESISISLMCGFDAERNGYFSLCGFLNAEKVIEFTAVTAFDANSLIINGTLSSFTQLDEYESADGNICIVGDSVTFTLPLQMLDGGSHVHPVSFAVSNVQLSQESELSKQEAVTEGESELPSEGLEVYASQEQPNEEIASADDVTSVPEAPVTASQETVVFYSDMLASALSSVTCYAMPVLVDTSIPGLLSLYLDDADGRIAVLDITPVRCNDGQTYDYESTQHQKVDVVTGEEWFALPFMLEDATSGTSRPYQLSIAVNQGDHAPDLNLSFAPAEPIADPMGEPMTDTVTEVVADSSPNEMEMPVEPDVMAEPAVTADEAPAAMQGPVGEESVVFDPNMLASALSTVTCYTMPVLVDTSIPGLVSLYLDDADGRIAVLDITPVRCNDGQSYDYESTQHQKVDITTGEEWFALPFMLVDSATGASRPYHCVAIYVGGLRHRSQQALPAFCRRQSGRPCPRFEPFQPSGSSF